MAEKLSPARIEDTLMKQLRFGGIDKENLKELVAIVAGIRKKGMRRLKVFPKGIPVPDGLRVSGILEVDELPKFLSEMLTSTARLSGVVVFPYGIPWPEIFRVNIDIGSPIEAESMNQF